MRVWNVPKPADRPRDRPPAVRCAGPSRHASGERPGVPAKAAPAAARPYTPRRRAPAPVPGDAARRCPCYHVCILALRARPGRPPVDGAGPAPRRAGHIPERPAPPFRYGCLQPFPRTCRDPRPYVSSGPDSRAPGRHPPPLWCRLWHGGPGEKGDLCFLVRHAAFHSLWRVPCIPPGTAPPADGESAKRKSAVAWPLPERSAGGCPAAPGPSRRCRRGDESIRSPRTERRPTAESHKATLPHLPWHRSRSSP